MLCCGSRTGNNPLSRASPVPPQPRCLPFPPGSIGRATDGSLLVAAPQNTHWRYPSDRRDLTVWKLRRNATAAAGGAEGAWVVAAQWRVWAGPAAYSSISRDGAVVAFEGGAAYRYQSIMAAPTNASARA